MPRSFIIAEAGVNHNGSPLLAMRLADVAKDCGADAVKYQLFSAAKLKRHELRKLELSYDDMRLVAEHCARIGIEFMCTPFDVEALDFLVSLGVKRLKISSGCLANWDLLYAAYQSGLPVILSTGMGTMEDVKRALGHLHAHVTLLHCTSAYPCPVSDVNLAAMRPGWGLSDHTEGIHIAIAAVARGAVAIEKHLTLYRKMEGPDQASSIEPPAFLDMVRCIRDVEAAIGDGVKRAMPSEKPCMEIWRRGEIRSA